MKLKGQGALEYLMTYGWALLIIVVVGAALFALGVFTPTAAESCTGFSGVQYQDHLMTATVFTIEITNTEGADIEITQVQVGTKNTDPVWLNVSAGSKSTIVGTIDPTDKAAGDTYSEDVAISYNVIDGISGKIARGTCSGKIA